MMSVFVLISIPHVLGRIHNVNGRVESSIQRKQKIVNSQDSDQFYSHMGPVRQYTAIVPGKLIQAFPLTHRAPLVNVSLNSSFLCLCDGDYRCRDKFSRSVWQPHSFSTNANHSGGGMQRFNKRVHSSLKSYRSGCSMERRPSRVVLYISHRIA